MRGIRKSYLGVAAALGLMILGWSCAKESPSISGQLSRKSFESWVEKYAPAAYANPYKDIYIAYIKRSESGSRPVTGY